MLLKRRLDQEQVQEHCNIITLPPQEGVGTGGKDRGGRRPLGSTRGREDESRGGGGRGEEMLQEAAVAMTTVLSSWPDSFK